MRVERIETVRRILCVFPRYTSAFGTFEYSYPLTDGVQAFMPPQGLLLIAAYLPENWQVVFETTDRVPMTEFPIPAYELAEVKRYFLGSIQYSSGCPYQCEFCDIPGLYGRNPRLKTPQQIIAELDRLRECGVTDTIYFVDDNFIGNRKAAVDLLPHLIEWQKRTGYVVRLACEATLNIAKRPEILEKMREAFFVTIFCGIETPDPEALKAMHKDHNMMVPILEGVRTINSYGMEVVSCIIMGLDTDKPETADALLAFIEQSRIPLLTINLLQALPKTPLWDRLERENRLIHDEGRDSNVDFLLPYDQVLASWRRCMEIAYQPEKVYARYQYQCDFTYANQLKMPVSAEQKNWANIKRGLIMLRKIFWKVGVLSDYRKVFWKFALGRLRRGDLEGLIGSAMIAHHLIMFARAASVGQQNASNYSLRLREASVPAE